MSPNRIMSLTAECPQCDTDITFERMPRLGQKAVCESCNTKMEVAFLYPIMLDWADNVPLAVDDGDKDY